MRTIQKKYRRLSQKKKGTPFSFKGIFLLCVLFLAIILFLKSIIFQQMSNPIAEENQKPGTTSWESSQLKLTAFPFGADETSKSVPLSDSGGSSTASTWTDTVIRGYPNQTSINAGSIITFYISTAQSTYTIEIYRMGWYGGTGSTLIKRINGLIGQNQPVPTPDPITGLIDAEWKPSYTLSTDSSWTTGVYLAKLIPLNGPIAYIPFVVRKDSAPADIVYVLPVATYQAYNNWGGKSLYEFNSDNGIRAYKVSFNRPYSGDTGTGNFFTGDYNMIRFLEKNNYNITYATSIDLQTNPNLLSGRKIFLSNFHDEYWSMTMRSNIKNALGQGKNLAFFDANAIYWQIRFENSSSGIPNRTIVCYKDVSLDPMSKTNPSLSTIRWRDDPVNMPENAILGEMYESYFPAGTTFPWVVNNANHWIYNGTGAQNGNSIQGVVGYEYDKVWNNGLTPSSLITLSNSPVTDVYGNQSTASGSLYTASPTTLVFDAGTMYWEWKLDDNDVNQHGADPRIQQMTLNILNTMISGTTPTPAPSSTPTSTPTPPPAKSVIYDDSLENAWADYSWDSTVNFSDTSHVYSGSNDIAWTPNAGWAGLSFYNTAGFNTTGYQYVSFAMEASQQNETAEVHILDPNNKVIGSVNLANYGGNPPAGSYKLYTIPLSALNAQNILIKGVQIVDNTTNSEPIMYVDQVGFQ